jgi:methylenetetrahydrofolate dehydrogenase (NADP+)/methenyltetrahydrofolate cyclohydrolase
MKLLDGKEVSAKIKEDIKREATEFTAKAGRKPHLVAILVGNDGGSETYVASKMRNCELVGFDSTNIRYEADITEAELLAKIAEINQDPTIDGLIVQLP